MTVALITYSVLFDSNFPDLAGKLESSSHPTKVLIFLDVLLDLFSDHCVPQHVLCLVALPVAVGLTINRVLIVSLSWYCLGNFTLYSLPVAHFFFKFLSDTSSFP